MGAKDIWATIEEYKTLRDEVLKVIEQRTFPLVYMSTLSVMLVAAAIQFHADFLYALVLSGIFPIALHWIGKRASIHRISYYIKTQIEPKVPGLNWETWLWKDRGNKIDDFEAFMVSTGPIVFHVLAGLGCSVYYAVSKPSWFSISMLLFNAFLASILVYFSWACGGVKETWRARGRED